MPAAAQSSTDTKKRSAYFIALFQAAAGAASLQRVPAAINANKAAATAMGPMENALRHSGNAWGSAASQSSTISHRMMLSSAVETGIANPSRGKHHAAARRAWRATSG